MDTIVNGIILSNYPDDFKLVLLDKVLNMYLKFKIRTLSFSLSLSLPYICLFTLSLLSLFLSSLLLFDEAGTTKRRRNQM